MKRSIKEITSRRESLLALLEKEQELSVRTLSGLLGVSEITIRRDLTVLEEMGQLQRTHGGAVMEQSAHDEFENDRIETIKHRLASEAAAFVHEGDTLFINTGTTALYTLNYLNKKRLTVISNNVKIANMVHNPNSTIILSGGEIRFPKEALVGDIAIDSFAKMSSDITIIGCSGISVENGMTTPVLHESKINNLMIERTKGPVILVADYRKIGFSSNFTSCQIQKISYLITDPFADPKILAEIEKEGVKVIQILL